MDDPQKDLIQIEMTSFCDGVVIEEFIAFMGKKRFYSKGEIELINGKDILSDQKVQTAFRFLQSKEGGWVAIMEYLEEKKVCGASLKKMKALGGSVPPKSTDSSTRDSVDSCEAMNAGKGAAASKARRKHRDIERIDIVFKEEQLLANGDGPFKCDDKKIAELVALVGIERVFPNFSKPRGILLVINNYIFTPDHLDDFTHAYEIDKQLADLWQKLGYEGWIARNLTAKEMKDEMKDLARDKRLATCDSIVVVILSHGCEDGIYGVDGETISKEKICERLNDYNCGHDIIKKPKFFIFDACRGDKEIAPKSASTESTELPRVTNEWFGETAAKGGSDKGSPPLNTLVTYACAPGFKAYCSMDGSRSFLTDEIIKVVKEKAHVEHVQSMMAEVEAKLCAKRKQLPKSHDDHDKYFYLFPGYYKTNG